MLPSILTIIVSNTHAVVPLDDCAPLIAVLGICGVTTTSTTSFLFLLRVRAVYLQSRRITVLFGTLWLVTVVLNIFTNALLSGSQCLQGFIDARLGSSVSLAHIPHVQRCIIAQQHYFSLPSVSTFVYDNLVFLAISYRLASNVATEQS